MIINNILRTFSGYLSAWYPNKEVSGLKDTIIRREINKILKDSKIIKKNLKRTHTNFNNQIYNLLKQKDIKNFLRKNFIQKMFFLQNRLFIYKELLEIKNSKNWKKYEKLLSEENVGNPIRYFLYLKSSGNRINHIYQIKTLENTLKINIKKNIKTVFEFGGGYGLMANIFSKINKNIKYICFDTEYVNLLQYYYLKHINLNVGFKKNKKIFLTSNLYNILEKSDLFLANWSFSEAPLSYRKKFINKIFNSKYLFISFQEKFENINNLKYFYSLKKKFSKRYDIKIIKNKYYKGNMIFKQNHFFFIGKKLKSNIR